MLEKHFRDAVSVEFAVQDGRLSLLQVRCGTEQRLTPPATLRVIKDLVEEGTITEREALLRVPVNHMQWFCTKAPDPSMPADGMQPEVLGRGLTINYGTVTGKLAFTSEDVRRLGSDAIYVMRV